MNSQAERAKAYEDGVPVDAKGFYRMAVVGGCKLSLDGHTVDDFELTVDGFELSVEAEYTDEDGLTFSYNGTGEPRRVRNMCTVLLPDMGAEGDFLEINLYHHTQVMPPDRVGTEPEKAQRQESPVARDIRKLLEHDGKDPGPPLSDAAKALLAASLSRITQLEERRGETPRPTNQALLARLAEENRALLKENDRMRRAIQALPVDTSNLNHIEMDRLIAELQASTATALRVQTAGNDRVWHRLHHTTVLVDGVEVLDTLLACTLASTDTSAFKSLYDHIYIGHWRRRTDGGWHTQQVQVAFIAGIKVVTDTHQVAPIQPPAAWEFDDMSAALLP